ncbi:MAG: hypothetical protein EOO42_09025 [Flavobacteriales bacterium]|nr:MAG: hypothetical protein EOO42_09025 [Flavobacteriales bacterium]
MKRRYSKPYRPQTNGKAKRFWRTLKEDLIEDTDFYSLEELHDELLNTSYIITEKAHYRIDRKKTN